MRRFVLLLLPVLALCPARADAITVRDIVELSRAGLGDDVLLALIEVDPSVFPIDAATLKAIKAAGVSDRVIVAMVRSSRTPPPPLDPVAAPEDVPQAPEPQVVVIDHHEPPVIREVQVPYPIYIPVSTRSGLRQHRADVRTNDLRINDVRTNNGPTVPTLTLHPEQTNFRQPKPAEPVYWGNGGKLRPDAWKPQ
jgi:hypothetical protein